jgi:hypothetical protein
MMLRTRVPGHLREPLLCALACAEEHVRAAQIAATRDLLNAAGGAIPIERALPIALRLLGISPSERRAVSVGVLAQLGRTSTATAAGLLRGDGLLARLQRRLGGRRALELRRRLSAEAVHARAALHAAYLSGVAEVLAVAREEISRAETVQLYLEHLRIAPGWAECVFHDALGEIAA